MIVLPLPRLRTLLFLLAALVGGMMLAHPGKAAADPALPPPDSETGSAAGQVFAPPTGNEATFWSSLGVVVGRPAPSGWVTGDGSGEVGPYFGEDIEGQPGRTMPDGSVLMASGDELPTVIAHSADPLAPRPFSLAVIDANGTVTEIDGTGATVSTPTPQAPLLDTNPVMWLAAQFGGGASVVTGWTLNDAVGATTPDLSLDWFVETWALNYGIGTVTVLFLVAVRIGVGIRRGETGTDFVQDLGGAVLGFFVAGGFGPPVGQFLITASAQLADNIAAGGVAAAFQTFIDAVNRASTDDQAFGHAIIALIVLAVAFIASVLAFIVMIASTAAIYLSAAMFTICFAWVVIKRFRAGAFRIVRVFATMVAAKPVLYLVMAVGAKMIGAGVSGAAGSIPPDLTTVVVGIIIMLVAGGAPVLVWTYLGVSDQGGGHAAPGSGATNILMMSRGAKALRRSR